mgnify:CR=1 FL=1
MPTMSYSKKCSPSLLEFEGYKLSQKQKALITKATAITLGSLVSKRLAESLEITIEINRNLFKETGTLGNCGLEDDARSPKYFIIDFFVGFASMLVFARIFTKGISSVYHLISTG